MANSALTNPAAALAEAGRQGEIRSRLLFLVGALVVYRIGTFIPVPGINPDAVARRGLCDLQLRRAPQAAPGMNSRHEPRLR